MKDVWTKDNDSRYKLYERFGKKSILIYSFCFCCLSNENQKGICNWKENKNVSTLTHEKRDSK